MSEQTDDAQRRDALLLRLLKTPPQPRPHRERGAKKVVNLSFDDALAELDGLLVASPPPPAVFDVLDLLADNIGKMLFVVPEHREADIAPEPIVRFEPTRGFLELLSAARAHDYENFVLIGHRLLSSPGSTA